jgi:hypothetical protein
VCGSRQAKQKDKKPASVKLNAPKKYKIGGRFFRVKRKQTNGNKKGTLKKSSPATRRRTISFFFLCFVLSVRVRPSVQRSQTHVSSRRGNRDRPRAVGAHALLKAISKAETNTSEIIRFAPASDTRGSYCGPSRAICPHSPYGTHACTKAA